MPFMTTTCTPCSRGSAFRERTTSSVLGFFRSLLSTMTSGLASDAMPGRLHLGHAYQVAVRVAHENRVGRVPGYSWFHTFMTSCDRMGCTNCINRPLGLFPFGAERPLVGQVRRATIVAADARANRQHEVVPFVEVVNPAQIKAGDFARAYDLARCVK